MPFQAWASCPATIVYRPRPYRHTTARLALLYAKSEAVQWRNGATTPAGAFCAGHMHLARC